MAKKPKAIELVFRAQPAMALLLEVMKSQKGMEGDLFAPRHSKMAGRRKGDSEAQGPQVTEGEVTRWLLELHVLVSMH